MTQDEVNDEKTESAENARIEPVQGGVVIWDSISHMMNETAEQAARDMLERMGIEDAQSITTVDLMELTNLIAASKKATPPQEWEPLTPERLEKLNRSRSEEPATYWVAANGQHHGEKPYLGTYSYFDQVFYCDDERAIHASNVTHIMAVYIPELPKA
jgi:hypothetical protein